MRSRSLFPGGTECTLRDGNTPCNECWFVIVRVFTFAERTAPARTWDRGIISPPSPRFVIAPCGRQCFPAATQCDRLFPSNQNCEHCWHRRVGRRGCGLDCCPEPPGGTPTCLSNGTRWPCGTGANSAVQDDLHSRWADFRVCLSEDWVLVCAVRLLHVGCIAILRFSHVAVLRIVIVNRTNGRPINAIWVGYSGYVVKHGTINSR